MTEERNNFLVNSGLGDEVGDGLKSVLPGGPNLVVERGSKLFLDSGHPDTVQFLNTKFILLKEGWGEK